MIQSLPTTLQSVWSAVIDYTQTNPFQTLLISAAALLFRRSLINLFLIRFGFFVYVPLHALVNAVFLPLLLTDPLSGSFDIDIDETQTLIAAVGLCLSPLAGRQTSAYVFRNVRLRARHRALYQPQGIRTPGNLFTDTLTGYVYGLLSIVIPLAGLIACGGTSTALVAALVASWLGDSLGIFGLIFGLSLGLGLGSSVMFGLSDAIHGWFAPHTFVEELQQDDPGFHFRPLLSSPNQHPSNRR